MPAKKSRQKVDQEEKTESDDFDSGNEANGNGSDCEEDRKFERTTNKVNLKSVKDKRQIRIKVKCWDCSEIITTSKYRQNRFTECTIIGLSSGLLIKLSSSTTRFTLVKLC
jgi:hypothetical protein